MFRNLIVGIILVVAIVGMIVFYFFRGRPNSESEGETRHLNEAEEISLLQNEVEKLRQEVRQNAVQSALLSRMNTARDTSADV